MLEEPIATASSQLHSTTGVKELEYGRNTMGKLLACKHSDFTSANEIYETTLHYNKLEL